MPVLIANTVPYRSLTEPYANAATALIAGRSLVSRSGSKSTRRCLKNPDAGRHYSPSRTIAREDRDFRAEQGRAIKEAGINRERLVLADVSVEDEHTALRAEISYRFRINLVRCMMHPVVDHVSDASQYCRN